MESWELHAVARRHLMDRYDELTERYAALPNQGRARDGYRYSVEAKRRYPRYNVVAAMLEEVERLDPDHLPDPGPLAAALVDAAETARSPLTEPPMSRVEAEAMDSERRRFSATVHTWMSTTELAVDPLPYRRVLRPEESSEWRRRLESRWGLRALSWYPMLDDPVPEQVLVLREVSMWDGPGVGSVREVLHGMGRVRAVELREYGAGYVLDVDLLSPRYTGAEGVWTDDTLDWIAFASHEGTIAFGGTLAAMLPESWPHLDEWRWTGW
jgi:hypothetical protein